MNPTHPMALNPTSATSAAVIRAELQTLHDMDPSSSRLLEALACVLTRVASADDTICEPETATMEGTLMRLADLPEAQAVLAVEIAKQRLRLGGTGYRATVSRDLRVGTDPSYRLELLNGLVDVACADGTLCEREVAAIRRISAELGFSADVANELIERSRRSLHA